MKNATSNESPEQHVDVFQLKVTLLGTEPPIWRRILVPVDISLADLHSVLQLVMGWTDSHLHSFAINGITYSSLDFDLGKNIQDESRFRLYKVLAEAKEFLYSYDFGDNWQHEIRVEDSLSANVVNPGYCLSGAGACPPEDCGGPMGYADFLTRRNKRANSTRKRASKFDPAQFDAARVNATLAAQGS